MRTRQRERKRSDDFVERLLNTAVFRSNLKTDLYPVIGTGGPTWSRATEAWRFDENGYLRSIPSGCAEFGGARLVRNTVRTKSEDFRNSPWNKVGSITIPDRNTVVCHNSTTVQYIYQNTTALPTTTGQYYVFGARLQYVPGGNEFVQIVSGNVGFGNSYVTISLIDGSFNAVGGNATVNQISSDTFDVSIRCVSDATASNGDYFNIAFANSLSDVRIPTYIGDGIKSFKVLRAWSYDVTNYNPSYVPEYVSVGSDDNKNFLLHTDDFTQGAWTNSNVTVTQLATQNPINRQLNAQKIEATTGAATTFSQLVSNVGSADGNIFVLYIKQGSGVTDANSFLLRNETTATDLLGITINFGTGSLTYTHGSDGAVVSDVGGGWWKLELSVTSGISENDSLRAYIGFTGSSETANEYCYVYRPYLGRGITHPPFIKAVAGVYDPFGSGVDGARYFSTDQYGLACLDENMRGFRRESAATNNLLYCRVLSNAAWTTKTNITAATTAIGLDGLSDTATTLTATSTDAIILQPLTLASAARCASAYVKRKTGTGTISFTQDGGSSWTDITSQINSLTYTRVEITSTLVNPSTGFKISTSGDEIEVDAVQNEAGGIATSPILTTTTAVTRNTDSLTYQVVGNIDFSVGTIYAHLSSNIGGPRAIATVGDSHCGISTSSSTTFRINDGTTTLTKGALTNIGTTKRKRMGSWGPSGLKVTGDGLAPDTVAFDGSFGSGSTIIPGGTSLNGYIGPIVILNTQLTDLEMQEVTK